VLSPLLLNFAVQYSVTRLLPRREKEEELIYWPKTTGAVKHNTGTADGINP